ncbi:MAG TPA: tRNA-dihydrouridine synthase [Nitrospiraceae bacterium]|nr:tRNA-dihydrouridine synthase [Nitrospiraceae bacterium]
MSFWSELPQPIVGLAPMDGVTDAAFRRIVAAQGIPDVTFTEFTHVSDISRGPEYLLDSLIYSEIERPIVAQIYGKDPVLFYQAAHVVCELGFDGLDINMGCPSRNVASSGSGAALIKTPDLARAIVRAVKRGIQDWATGQSLESAGMKPSRSEAIRRMNERRQGASIIVRRPIPWSVKTRLGCDAVVINRWVEHLLEERPAAITIHGRTLAQMYRGEADWAAIAVAAEAARGTDTLILGNGDVRSLGEAVKRARESGVHGVLVGRATLGAPWFFRSIERIRLAISEPAGLETGPVVAQADEPDVRERFAVMLDHARQFEKIGGPDQFRRMRKHLGWYCKGFPHAAAMRARMFRVCGVHDVEEAVAEFFGDGFISTPAGQSCSTGIPA